MSHSLISEYIAMLVSENLKRSRGLGFGTSILLENLLEGKIEQAIEKNKNDPELIRFLQFAKEKGLQPKYVDLAVKGWKEKTESWNERANSILRIIDEFEGKIFQHLVPIEKKDVGKYKTWREFQNYVVGELRNLVDLHYREKAGLKKVKESGKRIYEDETYLIVEPKTEEASCKYGAGTKWCISATDSENHFNDYSSKGARFLFIINKKTNDKDAIAFAGNIESVEIFDAMDNIKREEYISRKYPINVLEKINEYLESITGQTIFAVINYDELYKNPLSFMSLPDPNKIFTLDPTSPETFRFISLLASALPQDPQVVKSWRDYVERLLVRYVMGIGVDLGTRQGQQLWSIMQKDPEGSSWDLPAVPERMILVYALLNDTRERYHNGLSAVSKAAVICSVFMPVATSNILNSQDLNAMEKSFRDPTVAKHISNMAYQLTNEAKIKIPTKFIILFESAFPSYAPSGDLLYSMMIVKEFFESLNISSIDDVKKYLESTTSGV